MTQPNSQPLTGPIDADGDITVDATFLLLANTDQGPVLTFDTTDGQTIKVSLPRSDLDDLRNAAVAAADDTTDADYYLDLRMI